MNEDEEEYLRKEIKEQTVVARIRSDYPEGFVPKAAIRELAEHARFTLLLVRCGSCRFLARAQDVEHLIDIVDRDGEDYIRDVSFPAKSILS